MSGKLIAVDIDGTLCREHCWTIEDCLNATPRQCIIDTVNALYMKENHIVIWSSRREEMRTVTEYWLKKHNVCYYAIDLQHKLGADIYLDDKAISSIDDRIACELLGVYIK